MKILREALCADDVQLLDGISDLKSRSDVSLNAASHYYDYPTPIMSAPMDSLCSVDMGVALVTNGVTFIVDRYRPIDERFEMAYEVLLESIITPGVESGELGGIGVAVGMKDEPEVLDMYLESLDELISSIEDPLLREKALWVPLVVCFDVAAAANTLAIDHAQKLFNVSKEHCVDFIFGNFSSAKDVVDYLKANRLLATKLGKIGAALKVSQGGGSVCTTRLATGIGNPTFQAVMDLKAESHVYNDHYPIIADGGIKTSGDMVKMIGAGATFVMIGGLLSAHEECPGEVDENGMMEYRGMASAEAKRGFLGHVKNVEGVRVMKPCKGSVVDTIKTLKDGLRSGIATAGFISAAELCGEGEFVRVSSNATKMAQPHARDSK